MIVQIFTEIEECNISIPAATGRRLPGLRRRRESCSMTMTYERPYITISHCTIGA